VPRENNINKIGNFVSKIGDKKWCGEAEKGNIKKRSFFA